MNQNIETNQQLETPEYDGINVKLCSDGKYRWTYPMHMLKNPSVYITVLKIFGMIGAVGFIAKYLLFSLLNKQSHCWMLVGANHIRMLALPLGVGIIRMVGGAKLIKN